MSPCWDREETKHGDRNGHHHRTEVEARAAGIAAALIPAPATALASHGPQARPGAATATATVNWQVQLKGSRAYPTATGSAQYQSQPGQRELQLEVYRIRSLAGKSVVFYAGATKLGTRKVSATGIAQIDRNTELGQSVPTIVRGSTMSVRTAEVARDPAPLILGGLDSPRGPSCFE
jgi:hypothetical protein